ncbi:MAG: hypothetical protein K9J06_01880 [Flavobacteriales bacterium]|nr:hypothetical protein [Flavobacteriales bacterium]
MLFFLVASIFGLTMRYLFVGELPLVTYKHLLHAHSHVALMGWAYMLMSGALLFLFIQRTERSWLYRVIFILNVVSAAGMALSFPVQGYGPVSITFSTLHLFTVYVFAYQFLHDLRNSKQGDAARFARWSIYWLVLSTVGLWAIAPVASILGKLHPLYFMCIQFFLHFQLNGWLTFAVLALLVQYVQRDSPGVSMSKTGFWILQVSLLLTYTLSVTWSNPIPALFYINSFGVVLQGLAFLILLWPLRSLPSLSWKDADWRKWLLLAGVACIILKVLVHVAVALPVVAEISYTIKNFVIGFIHLVVIGSASLSAAGIMLNRDLIPSDRWSRYGWQLLLSAFLLTEVMLMGQGLLLWMELGFVPHYHLILFSVSAIFPVALLIVLSGFWRKQDSEPVLQTVISQPTIR